MTSPAIVDNHPLVRDPAVRQPVVNAHPEDDEAVNMTLQAVTMNSPAKKCRLLAQSIYVGACVCCGAIAQAFHNAAAGGG